jgi:D-glycero-alpha-D-manno-heptose 1-phosphate guanylyltransferase
MEAIILAGGFGTRLRPAISDIPKSMAPIFGQPFLSILLFDLSKKGFDRVILSVGYKHSNLINYYGKKFNQLELNYVIEDKPLGTGGAIKKSLSYVQNDHAFIFNGDTFIDLDTLSLESMWSLNNEPVMAITEISDSFRYGKVIERDGLIIDFQEKGILGHGYINCGCYVFSKNQLNHFNSDISFSIENDFFRHFVKNNKLFCFKSKSEFIDIGTPEDYFSAQNKLKKYLPYRF